MPVKKRQLLLIGIAGADLPLFKKALPDDTLVTAENSGETLKLLQSKSFDLAIINHQLPKESGLTLLKSIQSLNGVKLPTILLISAGEEKVAISAIKIGVADYLMHEELVPAIIQMTVNRAIEHQKWEKVYDTLSQTPEAASLKDPLTGLYNKCYFETRLTEEIKRSQRYAFPLTLVYFSIEPFPHIVKKYGSEAAAGVLKELASTFSQQLRGSDILSRIEEDHFAMLLPHTSTNQALTAWQRILEMISSHPFVLGQDNFYLTLKGVMTPLNAEIETLDALIVKLHSCLQKENGDSEPLRLYLPS